MTRSRVSRGIPDGGQFASERRSEPDVDLGSQGSACAILTCHPGELDRYVDDPDVNVKATAAWHPDLTGDQAATLAGHQQPFVVRAAIVRSVQPGTAERAATDPDPVIRWHAFNHGYDLPSAVRDQLRTDPGVIRVASAFQVPVPA